MSRRSYRLTVLGGVLAWAMAGLWLGRVLAALDAGAGPAPLDVALLALWTILGVLDVRALLRLPVPPDGRERAGGRAS
jgi:hypothetical protein